MAKKNNPQHTTLVISMGFLILFLLAQLSWAVWVSLLIGIIGVSSSYLSIKVDFLWMKLADLLAKIIPNLILGNVFFIFLFPIALMSKLFGRKDNLQLKLKSDTTYTEVHRAFDKHYFEKPW